jgi:NAD(P)-dependent dehydrogenase (short-subunit alcohol dehydrogenase family)
MDAPTLGPRDWLSFAGQSVIVTGAATGIGEAAARAFAALHAEVTLVDIGPDLQRVAAAITSQGGKAVACRVDATREEQVRQAVAECLARTGRLDVLVNSVGGFTRRSPTWEMAEAEWDQIVDLNLKTVFLFCKAVLPAMIERRQGRIVNVASGAARSMTHTTTSPYAAAKAGVLSFTRHLAKEVGEYGITVNAVAPGVTLTPRIDALYGPERKAELLAMIPLDRFASPEDQAGPIVFLASAAASYVTGATLDVNGGRYMI